MFSFEEMMKNAQNKQDKCRNGLKKSQHKDKHWHKVISSNVKDYENDIREMER